MGTNKEQNRISAILPTLDAAATLPQALSALCAPALLHEIIVADGGSRDDTLALARAAGARIVAAPRGRGKRRVAAVRARRLPACGGLGTGGAGLYLYAGSGRPGRLLRSHTR